MTTLEIVKNTAKKLGLLNPDDSLSSLDSLAIIDLVVALERNAGVTIPAASLMEENFSSLEKIAGLVERFRNA